MKTENVWFVTGASKGLGLTLVKKLLSEGYRVIATSRDVKSLKEEAGSKSENFLPLSMSLSDEADVKSVIAEGIIYFGRIDVVVNNAGFGQTGTLEELTAKEVNDSFAVNVFGALNVIRHITPYFRRQQSGHLINIASIAGYNAATPGWGIYAATKFALAGMTESYAEEVKEFNIKATVVYPGYFRTGFLSSGSVKVAANPIDAYQSARQSEKEHLDQINGHQLNDPEKAAEIFIAVTHLEHPPLHLFLGNDAYEEAAKKIATVEMQMTEFKDLATATEMAPA